MYNNMDITFDSFFFDYKDNTPLLTEGEKPIERSKSWDTIVPVPPLKSSRSQSWNTNELKSLTGTSPPNDEDIIKKLKPIKKKRNYILKRRSIVDKIFAPTHPEKNVQDTDPVFVLSGHNGAVNCLYPYLNKQDEIKIYTASNDRTIREWTVEKGACTKVFEGHTARVIGVLIDKSDDNILYSCSHDFTIKAWNIETTACLYTFNGHTNQVTCFGITDNVLYSGSLDKTIRLWDKNNGNLLATLEGHDDAISALQFVSNTLYSTSIDNTLRSWEIYDNDNKVKVDKIEAKVVFRGHTDWIWCVQILENRIYTGSRDTTIRQWDLTGTCLSIFEGHTHSVFRMSIFKEKLYSASWDGTIRIWDTKTRKTESILEGHHSKIQAVALDTEAEVLYSAAIDGGVRAWSMQGKLLRVYSGHSEAVNFLCEPSKVGLLVSASNDKTIKMWLPTNCFGRTITQIDPNISYETNEENGPSVSEKESIRDGLPPRVRGKKKQDSLGVINVGNLFI